MDSLEAALRCAGALDVALDTLVETLRPAVDKTVDETVAALDPLDAADTLNQYAYTVALVFFAYLKAGGEDATKHPVMEELGRVKKHMERVTRAREAKARGELADEQAKEQTEAFLRNALAPAISKVHFEGKHTRFEEAKEETPVEKPVTLPKGVAPVQGKVSKRKRARK